MDIHGAEYKVLLGNFNHGVATVSMTETLKEIVDKLLKLPHEERRRLASEVLERR